MKLLVRVLSMVVGIAPVLSGIVAAQSFMKMSEREQPPSSMEYVPYYQTMLESRPRVTNSHHTPYAIPLPADGNRVRVGIMINAYTSVTVHTNQLGYDYENDVLAILFRGGPLDQYPIDGKGSLIVNTSADGGNTWSGNSPVFNSDYPSDISTLELSARLPSFYAMNDNGNTNIAALWNQFHATFITPDGLLGTMIHKAGPLNGPYQGNILDKTNYFEYFPHRIVTDNSGIMYSLFQSLSLDQDDVTGKYYLLKSVDKGITWTISSNPILDRANIAPDYRFYDESITLDVSPDGTTIYIGFIAIHVENGSFSFIDNEMGYVYSSDGGNTWSAPVSYALFDWTFSNTPSGQGVDVLGGWMLPSMSVAVDGLNRAHFLMSVYGQDTFYPLDSTLIGEVTVNPGDLTQMPEFYTLALNTLPDFRRKINPQGAVAGPQPTFSIWSEHEWSKSPDGMHLMAKWIDADSIFVTTPFGHPQPFVRDSTHDIYILGKDIANEGNQNRGWRTRMDTVAGQPMQVFDIVNVTQSVGIDEKFTKMSPKFDPNSIDPATQREKIYFLYTIMATGEFVVGQSYPDTDDQEAAELYLVPVSNVNGIPGKEELPNGLSLAQNYPNPFNPATTISFTVARAGHATIKVLNMLGQEVGIAFDGEIQAGTHSATFNAATLQSGQYIYRLESNGRTTSRMMTLMK